MNIYSPKEISVVLGAAGFSFKKQFGQNFLINEAIPERIAEAAAASDPFARGCVEIGPGIGSLTLKLSDKFENVVAVEIDEKLQSILPVVMGERTNIEIVFGDATKLDLNKLASEKMKGKKISVCANLPYSITSELIMHILETNDRYFGNDMFFDSITLMIQKEAAQRLCAKPGAPEYGAITASASYYAVMKKLFDVNPGNFMPQPKVVSTVISIKPNHVRPVNPLSVSLLFEVIRASFAQRRKTLSNSLRSYFLDRYSKESLSASLEFSHIDGKRRGETLSLDEMCAVADAFCVHGMTEMNL
ncbi:MAG: 16S rRNA (adenine(1518)-N(6)/adenine(1519)-N(6))-dimethyltransferase RsmA [Oscillospiraceae bacterium]|nr:16S rRNA (adenine(1518)-N(6)/adenine(1519)-N(6))-dimethyltransferase RsmA [Oscillospiraceae bacterium]